MGIESLRADAPIKGWFTVEAGAFMRGQIRREIEGEALRRGLGIETAESKGLLDSTYRFTVRGEGNKVKRFIADCARWVKENESD